MTVSEDTDVGEARGWDFFVSYVEPDKAWAVWISWKLEEVGYRVHLAAWEQVPGARPLAQLRDALLHANRTLVVLSPAYVASARSLAEWGPAFQSDPDGRFRRLVPVRVEECPTAALLGDVAAVDLVGLEVDAAAEKLRSAIAAVEAGRDRPSSAPPFPGSAGGRRLVVDTTAARVLHRLAAGTPRRSARSRRPCDLPGDLQPFVGRTAEAHGIADQFLSGSRREKAHVVALHGRAGVGKSALAIHVAHRVHRELRIPAYFVHLGGMSAEPLPACDALGQVLTAMGVDTLSLPSSTAARSQLMRRMLAAAPAVLLFDDAGSVDQVRPLLPGAGSNRVIVTSRRPLPGIGTGRHHTVDVMSVSDSVALVTAVSGRRFRDEDEADVAGLAELAGRLPLALRVVAALLDRHASWTVGELSEELRDERTRLSRLKVDDLDVQAAINLSYRQLPVPEKQMLRSLGLLDMKTFALPVVSALAGTADADAAAVLDGLLDAQLLDGSGYRRYQFHDLVRLFAVAVAKSEPAGTDSAAVRRVVECLRDAASRHAEAVDPMLRPPEHQPSRKEDKLPSLPRALDLFEQVHGGSGNPKRTEGATVPEPASSHAARTPAPADVRVFSTVLSMLRRLDEVSWFEDTLDWFDVELDNLVRAQQLAADHTFHQLIVDMSVLLTPLLSLMGRFDVAEQMQTEALGASRQLGDHRTEALAVVDLANTLHRTGRARQAFSLLEQALDYLADGDTLQRGRVLIRLGHICREGAVPEAAADYYRQAAGAFTAADSATGLTGALTGLANVLLNQGKLEAAEAASKQAFATFALVDVATLSLLNFRDRAWGLENLATIYKWSGRPGLAAEYHKQSMRIFEGLGDLGAAATAVRNLGDCARILRLWDESRLLYEISLRAFQRTGNKQGQAAAFLGLTLVHVRTYRVDRATVTFLKAAKRQLRPSDLRRLVHLRKRATAGRTDSSRHHDDLA